MDAVDKAQDIYEEFQRKTLSAFTFVEVPLSGICLICEEPVQNARFCDITCRDEFDQRMKAKVRNGITKRNL